MQAAELCLGQGTTLCLDTPNPNLYAACIEGQCSILDVTEHANCASDDDCIISTKDCCMCGGDLGTTGGIAVDASFVRPDYCASDLECSSCEPEPQDYMQAHCQTEIGKCELAIFPR